MHSYKRYPRVSTCTKGPRGVASYVETHANEVELAPTHALLNRAMTLSRYADIMKRSRRMVPFDAAIEAEVIQKQKDEGKGEAEKLRAGTGKDGGGGDGGTDAAAGSETKLEFAAIKLEIAALRKTAAEAELAATTANTNAARAQRMAAEAVAGRAAADLAADSAGGYRDLQPTPEDASGDGDATDFAVTLDRSGGKRLGIEIMSATSPTAGVLVSKVSVGEQADGKMLAGDEIVAINGEPSLGLKQAEGGALLTKQTTVVLTIRREQEQQQQPEGAAGASTRRTDFAVTLDRSDGKRLGIEIMSAASPTAGVLVSKVSAGEQADGKMLAGDEIVAINGEPSLGLKQAEGGALLTKQTTVVLTIRREQEQEVEMEAQHQQHQHQQTQPVPVPTPTPVSFDDVIRNQQVQDDLASLKAQVTSLAAARPGKVAPPPAAIDADAMRASILAAVEEGVRSSAAAQSAKQAAFAHEVRPWHRRARTASTRSPRSPHEPRARAAPPRNHCGIGVQPPFVAFFCAAHTLRPRVANT